MLTFPFLSRDEMKAERSCCGYFFFWLVSSSSVGCSVSYLAKVGEMQESYVAGGRGREGLTDL